VPTSDQKNDELASTWEEIGTERAPSATGLEAGDEIVAEALREGEPLPAGGNDALADGSAAQEPRGAARNSEDEARAEGARDFVEEMLTKMGMDVLVDLVEPEPDDPPGEIRIEIEGRDSGRIIGKKGQVLAAIQHIVNRTVNRPGMDRRHIVVDAEGYRQRREDTLATMAQKLGKKALDEGKIITFEPMSPRDRRIVHLALAKFPGVVTKSDGEGEGRRVQIIPVRR
jgi:spoIIIJ-associated protein